MIALLFLKKEYKISYEKKNDGFLLIPALIIDFIVYLFALGLAGFGYVIILFLIKIPIHDHLLEILVITIFSSNVFFTSPGYKICKLFCPRYKMQVLLNNSLYVFLLTVAVNEQNIVIGIVAGLYMGLDFIFFILKRMPFLYYLFKIDIYVRQNRPPLRN
jgi:hypothetical protein